MNDDQKLALSLLRGMLGDTGEPEPGKLIESGPHKGKLQYVHRLVMERGRLVVGNEHFIDYFW